MYQPISFNVIRQALAWHGLPVPTLRQLSFYSYDPDNVMAEYVATWDTEQLRQLFGMAIILANAWFVPVFVKRISECFCEDVTIFDAAFDPVKEVFSVICYVTISREVIAAVNGDWLS